jgi:molybdopterin-binding protein
MEKLLTTDEAARLLHLNVKRVQALARSGRLPATRVGRKWLYPERAIARALSAGTSKRRGAARAAPVALSDATPLEISARNQLRGTIAGIRRDGMMAEVRLRIGDQEIVSVITRSSAERLGLKVGAEAFALIKSTEVMIGRF